MVILYSMTSVIIIIIMVTSSITEVHFLEIRYENMKFHLLISNPYIQKPLRAALASWCTAAWHAPSFSWKELGLCYHIPTGVPGNRIITTTVLV